jgi:DNA-binding MarR family transcriptional regulator
VRTKEISITQQQLSAVVGCTRSKLNALLKEFEQKGYIKLTRNKITLVNVELLNEELSKMNLLARDPRKEIESSS